MRSCLIVDDSETSRKALATALQAAQKGLLEFHEAATVELALQMFDEHQPDIVFLDMMLAGDDPRAPDDEPARGLGVLRAMLGVKPEIPIVIVTGLSGSQPDVVEAISLGAVAVLRKPVKPEEVKYILDAIEPDKKRMDYFA